MGMASFELGRFEDAIDAFDRSLALDLTNPDGVYYRDLSKQGLELMNKKKSPKRKKG